MKRLDCLDGLRGLLAIYVLLGHLAPFAVLPGWLQSAASHGGAAVDVFFMLSGLVITQSLLRAGGRTDVFLILRATRILPIYLVVLVVAVVVEPWSCGFEHMPWIGDDNAARTICVMAWPHAWLTELAAHLTMTHGLFPSAVLPDVWVSFLGAAWSLSTEWQFYLLALLVAGQPRPLCLFLLALAGGGLVWQATGPEGWQFSRAFLPNKAHFFALGVASLAVVRGEAGGLARYGLVLVASLAISGAHGSFGKMLAPLVWSFCLLLQTGVALPGLQFVGMLLRSRGARYLGAVSYPLYLVNQPIHKMLGLLLGWLAGGDALVFTTMWIPLAIGLPVIVSAWLHVSLEVPAMRWGRRVALSRASRSDPGAAGLSAGPA